MNCGHGFRIPERAWGQQTERIVRRVCYTAPVMLTICFDTSGPTGCVALVADDRKIGAIRLSKVYGHNETLLPSISLLLEQAGRKPSDLTGVAFVRGPGSFTGLRIGTAVAYGLSEANPAATLTGYTSLYLLSRSAGTSPGETRLSLVDARKKQVYLGVFQDNQPVAPYVVVDPAQVGDYLAAHRVGTSVLSLTGSALGPYQDVLREQFPSAEFLEAPVCLADVLADEIIAPAGGEQPDDQPLYIRKSDAELNRPAKR